MLGLVRGACVSFASLTLFSLQPHFGGCEPGRATPEDPVALPVGAAVECTGDDDCRTDACIDSRCLGGLCFVVSPTIDRDRDGQEAIPCGMDCDDADPNVNPGRTEACNSRDDNCNGMIDEGAPPVTTSFNLVQGSATSVGAPWGDDELLVTTTTTGFIPAFVVTPDMRVRGPIELVRLMDGSSFAAVQLTAGTGDRYLVSYSTDTGAMVVSVFERTGSTEISVVEAPRVLVGAEEFASTLTSIAFGDRFALLYETAPGGTRQRHLQFLDEATPAYSAPSDGTAPLDLTSDGTNLVFREGNEIVFVSPAGTVAARHALATPTSTPKSSIASGDGFVYALADSGSTFVRVSAAGGPGVPSSSVVSGISDVRIFRTGPFVLVTNTSFETEVVVLATSGDFIERLVFSTFTGTPPASFSAVPAFGGGAIVAGSDPSFGGTGAVIALARACGS